MSAYLEWNDAIAGHFFTRDRAGQPVWLYVNDELVTELGTRLEGDRAVFVEAVKAGPPWATAAGLCQRALQALEAWRDRGLEFPPYVGYLGLFVLAAGIEGDFSQREYYPRLRWLLGEQDIDAGTLPSFNRMLELWDDLETWSTRDRQGALGVFTARIAGNKIHIGLPIAQTVLSEDERRALPGLFAEAGLDPTAAPPDDELARMLRGATILRNRTRELVRTRRDLERYEVLLDTVIEELAGWDGTFDERSDEGAPARKTAFGSLRLCVRLDRTAARLSTSFRCRMNQEFPEEGFLLKGAGSPELSCCDSGLPGWSQPLVEAETGNQFDAASVDWKDGLSLRAENLGWRFAFPGRRVRVLIPGRSEGLPDLVEVRKIQRAQPLYFLYREVDWPRLAVWAEDECLGFRSVEVREGIPSGWILASCSEVTGDRRVRSSFPELALPERVRLGFIGGVHSGPGFSFFPFAPPSPVVEGGEGHESVTCNGIVLEPAPGTRSYQLPERLPVETRISVDVVRGNQQIKSRSIYLTGEFEWRLTEPQVMLDELGRRTSGREAAVAGALVIGSRPPVDGFSPQLMLTPDLEAGSSRVLFIGRVPGQIYSWPAEPHASGWSPVWAVPMRRRGYAVYCAGSMDTAEPAPGQLEDDPDRVDLWKLTLWYRRKRIRVPKEPDLAHLWWRYVEVARRV